VNRQVIGLDDGLDAAPHDGLAGGPCIDPIGPIGRVVGLDVAFLVAPVGGAEAALA
jgi:hypothetical protein